MHFLQFNKKSLLRMIQLSVGISDGFFFDHLPWMYDSGVTAIDQRNLKILVVKIDAITGDKLLYIINMIKRQKYSKGERKLNSKRDMD